MRTQSSKSGITKSKRDLNTEMELRWPFLLQRVKSALIQCGHSGDNLNTLAHDPFRGPAVTEKLLEQGLPEASFLPVLVGTLAFSRPQGLEWYPRWIISRGIRLLENDPIWFVNVALWQLLSIMANPFAHFDTFAAEVREFIDRLDLFSRIKNHSTLC